MFAAGTEVLIGYLMLVVVACFGFYNLFKTASQRYQKTKQVNVFLPPILLVGMFGMGLASVADGHQKFEDSLTIQVTEVGKAFAKAQAEYKRNLKPQTIEELEAEREASKNKNETEDRSRLEIKAESAVKGLQKFREQMNLPASEKE